LFSPDYLITIKVGNEDDHAILMASLMRTCKYEDLDEFNVWRDKQRKLTKTRKDKDDAVLGEIGMGGGDGDANEADETKYDGDETDRQALSPDKNKNVTPATVGTPKIGTVPNIGLGGLGQKEVVVLPDKDDVDDRVFVCIGRNKLDTDKK